jgi:hypothetical protein
MVVAAVAVAGQKGADAVALSPMHGGERRGGGGGGGRSRY